MRRRYSRFWCLPILIPFAPEYRRQFEKHVMDDEAHELMTLWWYRIVPYRSYLKGWHISPSHFIGNEMARVWLDK